MSRNSYGKGRPMKPGILSLMVAGSGLVAGTLFFPEAGFSLAGGSPHFSATQIMLLGNGRTMKQKVYIDGMKVRTEPMIGSSSTPQMINILLIGSGNMYMIMPRNQMCMRQKLDPATMSQYKGLQKSPDVTVQHLGSTRLDGHPAEITLVTTKLPDGKTGRMKIWSASDLKGAPLKEIVTMAGHPPVTILYKNIDPHRPDPSLFVPPAHCRAFPGMGGMMRPSMPSGAPQMPFHF